MTIELAITGDVDKLVVIAHATKALGEKDLRRKLLVSMQRAASPLKAAAAASALARLPKAGGLNTRVASARFRVQTRTSPRTAGVRIVASNDLDLGAMDRGRVRHPVFGNRQAWVNQRVPSGWFTDPMRAGTPAVRASIERVLDDVATELVARTGRG